MAYATAAELRTRYRQGLDGIDEFAEREDADLTQALEAASTEIDSWRPQGSVGTAALAVLRDRALTLARMLVYRAQVVDPDHPIVRDAMDVRDWLRRLAAGTVHLPTDATSAASPAAHARTMVYGDDWDLRYTQP